MITMTINLFLPLPTSWLVNHFSGLLIKMNPAFLSLDVTGNCLNISQDHCIEAGVQRRLGVREEDVILQSLPSVFEAWNGCLNGPTAWGFSP